MLEKDWQDLRLMHQAPFLLVKDLSNATNIKVLGACEKSLSFTFKLHEGGMPGNGTLLPQS